MSEPRPTRVRVTSPRHGAPVSRARRPRATELAEQTGLGGFFLKDLMRAQLRLALFVLAGAGLLLGGLPALFLYVPDIDHASLGPAPLPWVILAVLVYPVVVLAARVYVRQSERIERQFAELIRDQR